MIMTRKQLANVYRKAARLMESGDDECDFSCDAIWASANYLTSARAVIAYKATFNDSGTKSAFWLDTDDMSESDGRNLRILMLCMMAAMVEAGDA